MPSDPFLPDTSLMDVFNHVTHTFKPMTGSKMQLLMFENTPDLKGNHQAVWQKMRKVLGEDAFSAEEKSLFLADVLYAQQKAPAAVRPYVLGKGFTAAAVVLPSTEAGIKRLIHRMSGLSRVDIDDNLDTNRFWAVVMAHEVAHIADDVLGAPRYATYQHRGYIKYVRENVADGLAALYEIQTFGSADISRIVAAARTAGVLMRDMATYYTSPTIDAVEAECLPLAEKRWFKNADLLTLYNDILMTRILKPAGDPLCDRYTKRGFPVLMEEGGYRQFAEQLPDPRATLRKHLESVYEHGLHGLISHEGYTPKPLSTYLKDAYRRNIERELAAISDIKHLQTEVDARIRRLEAGLRGQKRQAGKTVLTDYDKLDVLIAWRRALGDVMDLPVPLNPLEDAKERIKSA